MGKTCLIAATLVALSCQTAAVGKSIYFQKADVDRDAFLADLGECDGLAGGVRAPAQPYVYSANIAAAGASAILGGLLAASQRRGIVENVMRTCMADKGYRRIEATPALKAELGRLGEQERLARLVALAASPVPAGTALPR